MLFSNSIFAQFLKIIFAAVSINLLWVKASKAERNRKNVHIFQTNNIYIDAEFMLLMDPDETDEPVEHRRNHFHSLPHLNIRTYKIHS